MSAPVDLHVDIKPSHWTGPTPPPPSPRNPPTTPKSTTIQPGSTTPRSGAPVAPQAPIAPNTPRAPQAPQAPQPSSQPSTPRLKERKNFFTEPAVYNVEPSTSTPTLEKHNEIEHTLESSSSTSVLKESRSTDQGLQVSSSTSRLREQRNFFTQPAPKDEAAIAAHTEKQQEVDHLLESLSNNSTSTQLKSGFNFFVKKAPTTTAPNNNDESQQNSSQFEPSTLEPSLSSSLLGKRGDSNVDLIRSTSISTSTAPIYVVDSTLQHLPPPPAKARPSQPPPPVRLSSAQAPLLSSSSNSQLQTEVDPNFQPPPPPSKPRVSSPPPPLNPQLSQLASTPLQFETDNSFQQPPPPSNPKRSAPPPRLTSPPSTHSQTSTTSTTVAAIGEEGEFYPPPPTTPRITSTAENKAIIGDDGQPFYPPPPSTPRTTQKVLQPSTPQQQQTAEQQQQQHLEQGVDPSPPTTPRGQAVIGDDGEVIYPSPPTTPRPSQSQSVFVDGEFYPPPPTTPRLSSAPPPLNPALSQASASVQLQYEVDDDFFTQQPPPPTTPRKSAPPPLLTSVHIASPQQQQHHLPPPARLETYHEEDPQETPTQQHLPPPPRKTSTLEPHPEDDGQQQQQQPQHLPPPPRKLPTHLEDPDQQDNDVNASSQDRDINDNIDSTQQQQQQQEDSKLGDENNNPSNQSFSGNENPSISEKSISTSTLIKSPTSSTTEQPGENKEANTPAVEVDPVEEKRKKRAIHRRKVLLEILETEKSYCTSLSTLNGVAVPALNEILNDDEQRLLFSNIETLLNCNSQFCSDLDQRLTFNLTDHTCIGDIFLKFTPYLKLYSAYVTNHDAAAKFERELSSQKRFIEIRASIFGNPRMVGASNLAFFFIMPIQRIPRYSLLLGELIKSTPEEHPDYTNLKKALEQVNLVAHHVNSSIAAQQQRHLVYEKAQMMGLDQATFVQPSRHFVKQGQLIKISRFSKDVAYEFFLFNDVLVYASGSGTKFKAHQQIPIDHQFIIEDCPDDPKHHHQFRIINSVKTFVAYANSSNEKQEWMKALTNLTETAKNKIRRDQPDTPKSTMESPKQFNFPSLALDTPKNGNTAANNNASPTSTSITLTVTTPSTTSTTLAPTAVTPTSAVAVITTTPETNTTLTQESIPTPTPPTFSCDVEIYRPTPIQYKTAACYEDESDPTYITYAEGEILTVLCKFGEWWVGQNKNKSTGLFDSTILLEISDQPTTQKYTPIHSGLLINEYIPPIDDEIAPKSLLKEFNIGELVVVMYDINNWSLVYHCLSDTMGWVQTKSIVSLEANDEECNTILEDLKIE